VFFTPRSGDDAAIRRLLCAHLACAPRDLVTEVEARGKPRIVAPRRDIAYSVSHSGPLTAVALMQAEWLGVDIEQKHDLPELAELAEATLSPNERAFLERAPEATKSERFLALWTRKEACLKALGWGVTVDLARMEVASPTGWIGCASFPDAPVRLFVHALARDGVIGAVAAERPLLRVYERAFD
jgi:phosphopantetheinyl transferase